MINQFLESVVVIDTETTAADPQQAEIVELATAVNIHNSWSVNSVLFGCVAGMPPEASEVTGISNRMLAGLPRIDENMHAVINMLGNQAEYFVAHNAQYDRTVLVRAFENSSVPELAQLFADPSRWICTLRLSRHMYGSAVSSHRQNYLRYALDLDVDDSLGVHRAGADVQVCAALLQTLVQDLIQTGRISADQPIAEQLVNLCAQPIPVQVWPLGKHRGNSLSELPTDYLLWAVDNINSLQSTSAEADPDLIHSVTVELTARLE